MSPGAELGDVVGDTVPCLLILVGLLTSCGGLQSFIGHFFGKKNS